jgi:hypothetical protein
MRQCSANIPPALVHLAVPPPSLDLPANFPNVETPRYLYGDKLRWICDDDKTDWGVVSRQILQLRSSSLCMDVVLPDLAGQKLPQCDSYRC